MSGYPILVKDPSTGSSIGVVNQGLKVSNVYDPARDLFINWMFGSETALETLTVSSANNGLFADISLLNPNMRQLVIVNGSSGGAVDYAYTLQFSRNQTGSATDDLYTATSAAAGAKAQIVAVPLPASIGFDKFARLVITPTAAQSGAQLTFKAYLIGRGG